jgi:urea transporter
MKVFGQQILPDIEPQDAPIGRQILRGYSQCAFQAHELTALFFIAGVSIYNWQMAMFYILSVIIATFVARAMNADKVLLGLGLFGFNAGLMGLALGNFFVLSVFLWIWVPILAAAVTVVAVLLSRHLPFPFLAAPFILMFWIIWPLTGIMGIEPIDLGDFPDGKVAILKATVLALGSTLFASNLIVGILFFIGVALSNWRHAVVAVIGAALAATVAAYVGTASGEAINSGFIGFNAVLAAIAAYALVGQDLRLACLAAFFATWFFSMVNKYWPEPALASGFVFAVWLIILLSYINPRFSGEKSKGKEIKT